MSRASAVQVAVLFPELLGTYGDGGNATVLRRRLGWRGIDCHVVTVRGGDPVPSSCDVYLLGGGEDGAQAAGAKALAAGGGLARAVEGGAAVLAVCAGMQVLGHEFAGPAGPVAGLGLLPCATLAPQVGLVRAVGEVVVRPDPALGLDLLVGFENHAGRTVLEPGGAPLGRCLTGTGNGVTRPAQDGVWAGRLVGTYLHGPVLALNPQLADLLLEWVAGPLPPLADPSVDDAADAARADRLRRARLPARTPT